MKTQRKKKQIQKIISILLITALSCVCVLGDYCQTNRNGRREQAQKSTQTVSESQQTSAADRGQGKQLRSIEELETAETETEPAKIQETLQEGYAHLSAAYESGASFPEAADAFADLVSQSEKQIRKELDQTDNGTEEHREYRDYILESYQKLGKYAAKLSGSNPERVMRKIREMMEPETPYVALGEDLPFHAVEESDIPTEKYTEAASREYSPRNTRYSRQELEQSNDTVINEKVRAEFQDLESPLEIYQYVKNHYMPEFYYGSRKGAIGAYEQKAGNDYDLASLLIGLLRDRSIPARYARGEIEITAEQAMDWTAVEDIETAQRQIAALGIPVTGLVSEGKTVAVRMEHVWVEAYVPYTDYRGAGNRGGESLWIPLDPAFKSLSWLEGVDLSYLSGYINQESNTVQEDTELYGVNIGEISTMTGERESAFVKYMLENGYGDATLAEAFGGREIREEDLAYLPLTLPYAVTGKAENFSDIPEELTDSISLSLTSDYDIAGENLTASQLYLPDIYGKRMILTYVPAAEEDQAVLEQYGGLFQTPAYLLRLKPQLLLDGEIAAEGAPCPAGSQQKYTISIHSAAPGRQDSAIGNSIVAGGMYCIASDYGTMSGDSLQKSADRMETLQKTVSEESIYTEEAMGSLLDSIGKVYFARLDLYNAVISGQDNVSASRDFSVGMVGFNINVISSFGRPAELNEGGIFLDIGHNVHSVVSKENDEDSEKAYMLQSGIYASAMEHGILEQSTGVESVSTIKIFEVAQADNIPLHTITTENLSGEMNVLAVSDPVKQEIKSSVHAGKIIVIPEQEITRNQWFGVGYMVLDPDTFACGYMISGGLAGGAMTMGQAMGEYLTGIVNGLVYALVYELAKTAAIALLPLGGVTAVLFFIVECILLLDYIDSIIQLWNMYNETGDVVYLQEAFIQISVFISMVAVIPQMKPQLEKFQKSLQETMTKLKKVPEYKEGAGACFIAGTRVLSATGSVPIETVTAGDLVQSFDPQTRQVSFKEVEETFVRETMEFVHVTVGSEKITTTPEHPFYAAQKGFVKAEKLRAGDILCTVNGEYVIVEQVQHEILESPVTVYNFRVAENHTYYVGRVGVGVHNAKCAETGGSGESGSASSDNNTFKFSDMTENEIAKIAERYRTKAPIEIPETAKYKAKSMADGYEQISYKWNDGTYKYEVRWHTRTSGAPEGQGNTWVIQRTIPGNGGTKPLTQFLIGKNEWVEGWKWYDAINARKNGTATQEQIELLDKGHWKE